MRGPLQLRSPPFSTIHAGGSALIQPHFYRPLILAIRSHPAAYTTYSHALQDTSRIVLLIPLRYTRAICFLPYPYHTHDLDDYIIFVFLYTR